jgi:membrane protease YdiL (CAAX protease family)
MSVNLTIESPERARRSFPYSNWGPAAALLGLVVALGTGIALSIPFAVTWHGSDGELTTFGNVGVQLATAVGFLFAPLAIAARAGSGSIQESLRRLGVRRFQPSALLWMGATVGVYLLFSVLYALLIVEPQQDDIAEGFGALPVQVLLIVIAAPVSEELCFRGMLYGGFRERLPRLAAAAIVGVIFGSLHAFTGISAVPPLIVFGFLFSLLYEKTGSIVPGILLHMINNSLALLLQ